MKNTNFHAFYSFVISQPLSYSSFPNKLRELDLTTRHSLANLRNCLISKLFYKVIDGKTPLNQLTGGV